MNKYLYGKKEFLQPIMEGLTGFRFSDLSHYARIENELMRDEEMVKHFTLDKFSCELKINDHAINPLEMTCDPVFSFPAQHCYCLCFSNQKNSKTLYERFAADVCIEVNVDLYLEFLTNFFNQKFVGMEIVAKSVTYYDENYLPNMAEPKDLVFYKPNFFSTEDEFRIALFYPNNKPGFLAVEGDTIPFYDESQSLHLTISNTDPNFLKQFIKNIHELTA